MLQTLKLHNFKTFLNAEFQFSQRHLIVGKNNSGKTNLATAMRFLAATSALDLSRAAEFIPGGVAEICSWYLKSGQIELSCECRLQFDGDNYDYKYVLILARQLPSAALPGRQVELTVVSERLTITGNGFDDVPLLENDGHQATMIHEEQAQRGAEAHRATTLAPRNSTMLSKLYELETNRRAILFREYLRNWQYFSISPLAIRRGWMESQPTHSLFLDSLGEQLSNAIFHLKNVDERRYRRLIEHTNTVEPSLRSILFVPVPDKSPVPFVELEGQPRASWNGLSDGTLRALALSLIVELTAAFSPPDGRTPSLAIIEEPENGIFPGQIRRIFDLFEEWSPSAQFLFTSHSPYFIDMFDDKRECATVLTRVADRSEIRKPRPAEPFENGDRLTLSMEYASELFQ